MNATTVTTTLKSLNATMSPGFVSTSSTNLTTTMPTLHTTLLPTTFVNLTNATTASTPFWIWFPSTFPTVPTVVITQPAYYYTYSLYGYLVFLLLVCMFLVGIKLAYNRRQEIARQAALARRARRCDNPVVIPSDNQTNEPPKDDLPPAYDDIVQAKLALQAAAEEGRMTQNATTGQSTLTLTTFVDANGSNANLAVTDETLPPAYENMVFEHEDAANGNKSDNKNSAV